MKTNLIIGMVGVILFILIAHYWIGNYHNNAKFKIFLLFVTTLTSILISSAILIQVSNYANQRATEEVQNYGELSKIYLDETIIFFINHPEMNYYYNELFNNIPINENTKRNYILEKQLAV